jgi:prolyl-tRNA synthetase
MFETYNRIFKRLGLEFRPVEADTGSIGGSFSHEFMVLAETGEDYIVNCLNCTYSANLEKAEVASDKKGSTDTAEANSPIKEVETPEQKSVEDVCRFLSITPDRLVKTLIYKTEKEVIAVLVRGDHEINEAKLRNFAEADSLELANPDLVEKTTGAPVGFAGPVGLEISILADNSLKPMKNFVTGGNRKDTHLMNVNIERDFKVKKYGDLRVITPEDRCPRCGSEIRFGKGIEVGHVFKLGTKYSRSMGALFLDENGKEQPIVMGCYGIGVGRTLAAAIEQNHDKDGIIFPVPIAPFEVIILPLQIDREDVVGEAERIYTELKEKGVDCLLDDRDLRAGFKFKDADLLGIPLRITIGTKGLENSQVEVKLRFEAESFMIPLKEASAFILERLKGLYDSIK